MQLHPSFKSREKAGSIGQILYNLDRCAIAHIKNGKEKLFNPDDSKDRIQILNDIYVIEGLAKKAITNCLTKNTEEP